VATAKVPDNFTVQGVLRDGTGKLQSAMVDVTVKLFDASTSGNQLAGPYQQTVMAANGLFSVVVNDAALATELKGATAVWVEISVGASVFPRQQLTSEVYAIMAGHADEADALSANCNGCVTDAQIGGISASKVTGKVADATTAVAFSGALAGDVTGTQTATTVGRIQGVAVANTAPAAGQVLKYDPATQQWAPGNDLTSGGTVTSVVAGAGLSGGTITTSGTLSVLLNVAGGLTANLGTGLNELGISPGGVVPAMLASGLYNINVSGNAAGFTGSLSGDVTGGQSAATVVGLRGKLISPVAPTDAQVLKYSAAQSQWVPSTIPSGTVTQITTSAGLSGGSITTSGTIGLQLNAAGGLTTSLGVGSDELGIAPGGITPAMVGAGTYAISVTGQAAGFSGSLGGDVTGTMGATTVGKLQGYPVSITQPPTNGQVLQYNGTQWVPGSVSAGNGTVTGVSASPPLFSSGGTAPNISLTGTVAAANGGTGISGPTGIGQYLRSTGAGSWSAGAIAAADLPLVINSDTTGNAATVTNGVVTTGAYANPTWLTSIRGTIVTGPVASATSAVSFSGSLGGDVTGTQNATTVVKIQGTGVSSTAPTVDGQVLKYNLAAQQWLPGTDANSGGSVTSVTAGSGLAGGTITNTGTISIAPSGVTNAMLANSAVTIGAGSGLSVTGGGVVALGGTVTLTNTGVLSLSSGGGAISVTGGQNAVVSLATVGTVNGGTGLSSAPTATGQFLRSSGANTWAISSLQAGDVPSLSGSYVDLASNQTVAGIKTFSSPIAGSVTGSAASFTGALVGDVTGGQATTTVGRIQGQPVAATVPTAGQVLAFVAGVWTPSTPSGGVAAVTASVPLSSSGGANPNITLSGTVPVANGGTGISAGPTTATQFLRASAAGTAWTVGTIGAGDLPGLSGSYVDLTSAQTITGTKTFAPAADVASMVIRQTTSASVTHDVFDVQNSSGATNYLQITSAGNAVFSGSATAAQFNGSGAGLTALPAANLTGTVPATALSGTYPINVSGSAASFSGMLVGDVIGPQTATVVSRLQGFPVAPTPPMPGQVLKFNGLSMQWQPAGDAGISSITAGPGLTGGTITTSGMIAIQPGGVTPSMLSASSVSLTAIYPLFGAGGMSLGGPAPTIGITAPTSNPGQPGQFLRSDTNIPNTWAIGGINAIDLPSLSGSYVDLVSNQTVNGYKTFGNPVTFSTTGAQLSPANGGTIELGASNLVAPTLSTPVYIDFHYAATAAQDVAMDYDVRLANDAYGTLTVTGGGNPAYLNVQPPSGATTPSMVVMGAAGGGLTSDGNGSVELGGNDGNATPAGTSPYIDFHYAAPAATAMQDYNVRIQNNADATLTLSSLTAGSTPTLTFGTGGGFITNATYYGVGTYLTGLNGANIQNGTVNFTATKAPAQPGAGGAGTGSGIIAYPANLYTVFSPAVTLPIGGTNTVTASCAAVNDFVISGGVQATDNTGKIFVSTSVVQTPTNTGTWRCQASNSDTLNAHGFQCWVMCYPHP
jgi:hypothetical protein